MKRRIVPLNSWCAVFAAAGVFSASLASTRPETIPVLIAGDFRGYLSPCGCTSPMTGGIRRLATAVAQNRGSNGIFLVNGGLIDSRPANGRVGAKQNELKLQTLAEALFAMKAEAINIGAEEASGGRGMLLELGQLSEGRSISTSLAESPSNTLPRWVERGELLIGGVTPAGSILANAAYEVNVNEKSAVADLISEAKRREKTPVLMYRGGLDAATALARAFPQLALIVYQSSGTAPALPVRVANSLLITPGDHAKNLVRVDLSEGRFSGYQVLTLTPAYGDEKRVSKLYQDYLHRVDRAHLIEGLSRSKGAAFAGSESCRHCHLKAYAVWSHSAHSHALHDLEVQGHARDPDCLSCHVTGLASVAGFYTRSRTPALADVTCESCHGPAKAHVLTPKLARLAKLDEKSCLKCHESENSPNFNFVAYWKKISHH